MSAADTCRLCQGRGMHSVNRDEVDQFCEEPGCDAADRLVGNLPPVRTMRPFSDEEQAEMDAAEWRLP